MIRRFLILGLFAASMLPGPANAQDYATQVVRQLRQQGYTDISVSSTLLGRIRIVAQTSDGLREIIINPGTGEILRDLFSGSGGSGPRIVDDKGGNSGGEDKDEDENEDEDEDGNSGHSGGNSGGGGNSGSGGGGDGDDDDDDDDND